MHARGSATAGGPAGGSSRGAALVLVLTTGLAGAAAFGQPLAPEVPASPSLPAAAAEAAPVPAWVRAELRVNFRATPTPEGVALGVVKTGDAVRVVERRGSWARVQLEGGASGWLPASYLEADPPPLKRLAQLEDEVETLRRELAIAGRERDEARARNAELEAGDRENEAQLQALSDDNRVLRAGERWPYLVTGASILGAGMVAGALVRGWSSRRMGPRIRF